MKEIKDDPAGSAALWVRADHSKLPVAEAENIIRLPENTFTMTPQKMMIFADYMARVKWSRCGGELEGHVHRRRARSAGQLSGK